KKQAGLNQQQDMSAYFDSATITSQKQKSIDQALTRMFIISDNPSVITNREVNELLQVRNFFADVEILCDILKLIKEAVISLQANNANLAECFINICCIGSTFKKLSFGNNLDLKNYYYNIYNKRFNDFGDYEGYLLRKGWQFKNITGIAGKFAKNFGYGSIKVA
ncbi:11899_t:CDS:2, partial [Entrophospora sp. SA101]